MKYPRKKKKTENQMMLDAIMSIAQSLKAMNKRHERFEYVLDELTLFGLSKSDLSPDIKRVLKKVLAK